jgi:branched-chain amino acid transport system substrate-binding protein
MADCKPVRSAGLACVLLLVLVTTPMMGAAFASQPIRIGISLGVTGQFQSPSIMQQQALTLWRDDVNARGGIIDRPVELVIRDDRGNSAEAQAIYADFVSSGSIDLVLAPYSSELTAAVAPIVDRAGFPMLAPGASADSLWRSGYHSIFGILTPASQFTQGMLRLAHAAGLARIAILYSTDEFSADIANGTRRWAPYLRLKVVLDKKVDGGAPEFLAKLREARDAGADLVIIGGHPEQAADARQALLDLNWQPRAFFATIGPALPSWKDKFGPAANLTFASSVWEPNGSHHFPGSTEFANAFRTRFGVDPSYQAASAYAAGEILEAAIRSARSLDHEALREALVSLDTYTVLGRFAVDRAGMQTKRLDMIVQWQNGRKEIVWPDEIHTAEPVFGGAAE